jgi:hypothetical protein
MNPDLPLSTASASKVFIYLAMLGLLPAANCLLRGGQRGSFCWLTELPTYSIPCHFGEESGCTATLSLCDIIVIVLFNGLLSFKMLVALNSC